MSVLDINERRAYLESPYFKKHEYGDFSPFYITVAVCTILVVIIFAINIVLGCCSRYSTYWNDRHTGNRWIVSLWTATPHNQPSLDYTEINPAFVPEKVVSHIPRDTTEYSDLDYPHSQEQEFESKSTRQQVREYLELQQQQQRSRESEI